MAERILMRKRGSALIPDDERAVEALSKLPNKSFIVEIKQMRNPRQHRLFFALCQIILENTERYQTVDQVVLMFKIATGHYDEQVMKNGNSVYIPKSISFGNMSQAAFRDFFDRVLALTCSKIIPNLEEGALRRELEEIVGI